MIFAIIDIDGKEELCCVDKVGARAFPIKKFFQRDLKELRIESNRIDCIPQSMDQWIENYNLLWTDDLALFFGSNPDLAIELDAEKLWKPLIRLDEIWSPLETKRGPNLLK